VIIGIGSAFGGYTISQAYRISEAAFVAPFEYVAMPVAIFLGVVVFGDWPDPIAWVGIALIVASGLFTVWRETVRRVDTGSQRPKYRR
jgi:drug/metabolite transporter (DMT)-like permease